MLRPEDYKFKASLGCVDRYRRREVVSSGEKWKRGERKRKGLYRGRREEGTKEGREGERREDLQ